MKMSSSPTFPAWAGCEAALQKVRVQCMAGTCPPLVAVTEAAALWILDQFRVTALALHPPSDYWYQWFGFSLLHELCFHGLVGALKSCFTGVQMLASSRGKGRVYL